MILRTVATVALALALAAIGAPTATSGQAVTMTYSPTIALDTSQVTDAR